MQQNKARGKNKVFNYGAVIFVPGKARRMRIAKATRVMSNAAWRKKGKPEWTVYSFVVPNHLSTPPASGRSQIETLFFHHNPDAMKVFYFTPPDYAQ
ncbi:MAG: hypothetical protein H6559_35300 [Lewinellaceae bacterium]|nr:hypothetical protein [Lewinellaceae bacterium]